MMVTPRPPSSSPLSSNSLANSAHGDNGGIKLSCRFRYWSPSTPAQESIQAAERQPCPVFIVHDGARGSVRRVCCTKAGTDFRRNGCPFRAC
jgi:hypothetical protein